METTHKELSVGCGILGAASALVSLGAVALIFLSFGNEAILNWAPLPLLFATIPLGALIAVLVGAVGLACNRTGRGWLVLATVLGVVGLMVFSLMIALLFMLPAIIVC